ncbi:exosome non-catalytic core subunit [Candida albicans SC5314]|uniref:Exosome non-catalytic core subunit n=1 Tax=Candida albicans (strain SC5314 / ATCC MYA-2876) TaxID=237561 RepID=A0A1D8PS88_CANAL|nr:exosome non-catalytic core subunit [Candida albicans SC5314]AOW30999.1 exosome non-catalytic core subunit [Candida albicans SC5314]|eukprot:XP_710705.2 exosome non-catalytic core subunit [Candida albicans SC5314]
MSDRRRLLGPSGMIIPNIPKQQQKSIITTTTTTSTSTIPSFFLKHSIIDNANGSAYLEINNTIIEVSIFGPRPIRGSFIDRASVSVDCKFLPHIIQPMGSIFNDTTTSGGGGGISSSNRGYRTGMNNIEHKLSSYLETCVLSSLILEKYPKSTIDIQVSIISIDKEIGGGHSLLWLLQWITCCCSLALVDSGIEMKDIISSGQVRLTKSGKIIIGGNSDKTSTEDGIDGLVSFMNLKNDEIVGIWFEGEGDDNNNEDSLLNESNMEKLIIECNKMSKIIRANLNSYLINSM